MYSLNFIPGKLEIDDVRQVLQSESTVSLDPACWEKVNNSEQFISEIIKNNKKVYGVNTGFGSLANVSIPSSELKTLQKRILLSHAAGTGELLPDDIVKLILLLKINSLARGYSGVRRVIIDMFIQFYIKRMYPCVPAKGSVGASGDLAPLAHLSLPLIGEGFVRFQGQIISGREALQQINQTPLELAPKEGLALINGTQVSTAMALYHLIEAQSLLSASVAIGALSVDAALGSDAPFDPIIQEVRGQLGQIHIAACLRDYLEGSEIRQSHRDCDRVQDPYCLRCQPQVLGACLDNINHVELILMREANAVTDNPLIFTETNTILSGGNFHAEPVAQAADLLAMVLAEIGSIAERRIALLVDPHFNSGLPAYLVNHSGLNSGFMIAHVTAAAAASANKSLAHPASVDSIPTSANQEDHVSMAAYAAYRLKEIIDNVNTILAIELLAACQAIDFRSPLKTSVKLACIHALVREHVPFLEEDRYFALDIEKAKKILCKIG